IQVVHEEHVCAGNKVNEKLGLHAFVNGECRIKPVGTNKLENAAVRLVKNEKHSSIDFRLSLPSHSTSVLVSSQSGMKPFAQWSSLEPFEATFKAGKKPSLGGSSQTYHLACHRYAKTVAGDGDGPIELAGKSQRTFKAGKKPSLGGSSQTYHLACHRYAKTVAGDGDGPIELAGKSQRAFRCISYVAFDIVQTVCARIRTLKVCIDSPVAPGRSAPSGSEFSTREDPQNHSSHTTAQWASTHSLENSLDETYELTPKMDGQWSKGHQTDGARLELCCQDEDAGGHMETVVRNTVSCPVAEIYVTIKAYGCITYSHLVTYITIEMSDKSCRAFRRKHEGLDTARLPKPRQGKSSGRGRVRITDLPDSAIHPSITGTTSRGHVQTDHSSDDFSAGSFIHLVRILSP
ncbi:hypothetical protein CLF_109789, partial [Clonorchis sinensis]